MLWLNVKVKEKEKEKNCKITNRKLSKPIVRGMEE